MHPAVVGFNFVPNKPNARNVSNGSINIKTVYSMFRFLDFKF